MMHRRRHLFPLCLVLAATHCLSSTSIEDMRSDDALHGLYEIREEARKFVSQENARNRGTEWVALEPNLKVLVPRCAVPLKARWDDIWWFDNNGTSELVKRSRRVISVACTHPKKWDVHVPVHQRRP